MSVPRVPDVWLSSLGWPTHWSASPFLKRNIIPEDQRADLHPRILER